MKSSNPNIILFGTPRSGSTWLSEIICHENTLKQVHEPDNELNSVWALHHKKGLPRFPFLQAEDFHQRYLDLFKGALEGTVAEQADFKNKVLRKLYGLNITRLQQNLSQDRYALSQDLKGLKYLSPWLRGARATEPRLIKTVHALLAFPFLYEHLDFQAIILERHPLNSFSSYVKMQMPDGNRNLWQNRLLLSALNIKALEKPANQYSYAFLSGFQAGIFKKQTDQLQNQYKEVHFLKYEELIKNPFESIPKLLVDLGLNYSGKTEAFMKERFTTGDGYTTKRSLEGQTEIWKTRLSPQEKDEFILGYQSSYDSVNFDL